MTPAMREWLDDLHDLDLGIVCDFIEQPIFGWDTSRALGCGADRSIERDPGPDDTHLRWRESMGTHPSSCPRGFAASPERIQLFTPGPSGSGQGSTGTKGAFDGRGPRIQVAA